MFTDRYRGQAAIVTGAGSGIGAAVALRLAQEGALVTLIDANQAALETQAQALRSRRLECRTAALDVSDAAAVAAATADLVRAAGRLDVLVHCAGIVGLSGVAAHNFPVEEFRRVLDVNLCGSFIVTQCALPHMLRRGYGRILLLASMAGKDGNPGMAGYVASKAGVIGLVKGIAKECAASGVTINALAPAVIATAMNADTARHVMEQLVAKIPMGRLGTVEETAAIACWICSAEASFNTGAIFDLSGGRATY